MFCMAWFMELSRLSNSLGSVCSQRRGRLPSPAPLLFQPLLPSVSLPLKSLEHLFFLSPLSSLLFHLAVSTSSPLQLTHEAVVFACPRMPLWGPLIADGARADRGAAHNGSVSAGTLARGPFSSSSKPPNLRSGNGGGTEPGESAHRFTSCPARHAPRLPYPAGCEWRGRSQQEVCDCGGLLHGRVKSLPENLHLNNIPDSPQASKDTSFCKHSYIFTLRMDFNGIYGQIF